MGCHHYNSPLKLTLSQLLQASETIHYRHH